MSISSWLINSVDKILNGVLKSPEDSHMNFVFMKREDGWQYGDNYSTRGKTNPRLCEWEELEDVERQKEEYFFAVVNSFIRVEYFLFYVKKIFTKKIKN